MKGDHSSESDSESATHEGRGLDFTCHTQVRQNNDDDDEEEEEEVEEKDIKNKGDRKEGDRHEGKENESVRDEEFVEEGNEDGTEIFVPVSIV